MEDAAAEGLPGRLGSVPVAQHRRPHACPPSLRVVSDAQLADLADRELVTRLVEDHDVDRVQRVAGGAVGVGVGPVGVAAVAGHAGRRLGQAVADQRPGAELLEPATAQFGRGMGGADDHVGESGQVGAGDVGVLDQVVDERRDQQDPGHPFALNGLGQAHGVGPVDEYRSRAAGERPDRAEEEQVQDRAGQGVSVALVRRDGIGGPAVDRRPEDVVLAVDGALGVAGGAARVADGRRGVRVDGHPGVWVPGGDQVAPRAGAVAGDGEGPVVPHGVGPLRGGDERRHVGVIEHPADLGRRQIGVDAQPDGAEALDREEGDDQFVAVGEAAGHPVAGADAECGQAAGGGGHLFVEFPVGEARVRVDEGLAAGVLVDAVDEQVGEGVRRLGHRRGVGADDEAPVVQVEVVRIRGHGPGGYGVAGIRDSLGLPTRQRTTMMTGPPGA